MYHVVRGKSVELIFKMTCVSDIAETGC